MADNWPTDTFTDLAALAAQGDGSLVRVNGAWTYAGAPLDTTGTNLRLPVATVSARRVWAAIVRQVWRPVAFDTPTPPFGAEWAFGAQPDPTKFFTGPAGARVDIWATDPTFLPPNTLPASCVQVVPVADGRAFRPARTLATCGTVAAATV